ncbi:tRNA-dihydrouridine synthase 4 [Cryptococcus wingfieldii CBS 7118]|uniref:tRNA-dihydrouridine synthase 4 n=1 Tax=Cryptococcus wingfieldii CBS 7118 TaxID=1295528 RepID=A0A1E3K729_9TREE|nr:tRNA-dihydrouridine synthase 4 [Cryptococcus wingfieldii CBS 7118]ODO08871.1 tRNA-dihydrouridine synthase 4 [Cryptococcus wingfieldii CBS 7118]
MAPDSDATDEQLYAELPAPRYVSPAEFIETYHPNVLAPLVRCSKLPFRHLTSLYETHITHTPMILAEEFSRAQIARTSDFSTSSDERGVYWMTPKNGSAKGKEKEHNQDCHPEDCRPTKAWRTYHHPPSTTRLPPTPVPPSAHAELVRGVLLAQFASPNGKSLADAAELISPFVDGLDLNCGCPQKWAYNEGIGCALLRKPDLVRDMVRATKDRMGWDWPVSIKIRIDQDPNMTELLISNALQAGISHLTIHGRNRHQPSTDPVNLPGIKFAVECVKGEVPCVANGDLWELEDARRMRRETGVEGVMAARGLLANPALFAGYDKTPEHCVSQFINIGLDYGFVFPLFHRHLAYMLESHMARAEKVWFNSLQSQASAIDFLEERGIDFRTQRKSLWDARRGRVVINAC